ncbi:MAG: 23S rRNA (uracil(1939)-C(5))-methyltransferase RlmD [Desulfuromonadales bacterium]|nr:23S rRNA (uracil(1939)-C(5))-methyltransferase RlmD [Desulfuromonadales bacterium]
MRDSKKEMKSPEITKGDILEGIINRIDDSGASIAIAKNRQIITYGGLPEEKVLIQVTYAGKQTLSGKIKKVISPSPSRKKNICNYWPECDGCSLIEMNYATQLKWKWDSILHNIKKYPSISSTPILPVLASPKQLGYRNSAKLVIAGKFNDPVIGVYRRKTHDVIDISDCALHHPLISRIIKAVKKGITKGKVPIYHPRSEQGLLRYLVIRVAENENLAMVSFVTAKRSYNELHHLSRFIQKEVSEIQVVTQNVNSSAGNVIFGKNDYFLTKTETLIASVGSAKFLISPRSFFQINTGSAEIIYNIVKEFSDSLEKPKILDLYCGIGAISMFIAKNAGYVLGVEVVESAVEDARKNVRLNKIYNCEFQAGNTVDILHDLIVEKKRFDQVIINPPRKGCESKVLDHIVKLNPSRIIYVSCSPETLARDLDILNAKNYKITKIQPVDMFPQTIHVETIASLQRCDT